MLAGNREHAPLWRAKPLRDRARALPRLQREPVRARRRIGVAVLRQGLGVVRAEETWRTVPRDLGVVQGLHRQAGRQRGVRGLVSRLRWLGYTASSLVVFAIFGLLVRIGNARHSEDEPLR